MMSELVIAAHTQNPSDVPGVVVMVGVPIRLAGIVCLTDRTPVTL
ncbi:hypothetical protein I541_1020 [Mycobacteroides abscessus]|nr:hypothetical protein L836_2286 [Mycobacteroides abscessus MAB_110811_2726]EUA84231.1 hypothetical protein I541_1020 [Mycobacteroides abscessus]